MKTIQSPKINDAIPFYFKTNEILGSYSENDKNQSRLGRFVYHLRSDISNDSEAETHIKLKEGDSTIIIDQIAQPETDEVIQMLKSWLSEEITEKGEKDLQEVLRALKENPISFREII